MTLTKDRPVLSSERAPHMDRTEVFKQEEISGHEPQTGLDTKTNVTLNLAARAVLSAYCLVLRLLASLTLGPTTWKQYVSLNRP
jgi:hypothetical protein